MLSTRACAICVRHSITIHKSFGGRGIGALILHSGMRSANVGGQLRKFSTGICIPEVTIICLVNDL